MPESPALLSRLRRRVARIEGARVPGGPARFATGHEAIDAWLGGGLARGRVSPAPSFALAADAPGPPAFDLELLRRRAGPAGRRWRVEWNRERRAFQPLVGQALSGAVLPLAAG